MSNYHRQQAFALDSENGNLKRLNRELKARVTELEAKVTELEGASILDKNALRLAREHVIDFQSVEPFPIESAPSSTFVLVWVPDEPGYWTRGYHHYVEGFWSANGFKVSPTFWLPLPPAPGVQYFLDDLYRAEYGELLRELRYGK